MLTGLGVPHCHGGLGVPQCPSECGGFSLQPQGIGDPTVPTGEMGWGLLAAAVESWGSHGTCWSGSDSHCWGGLGVPQHSLGFGGSLSPQRGIGGPTTLADGCGVLIALGGCGSRDAHWGVGGSSLLPSQVSGGGPTTLAGLVRWGGQHCRHCGDRGSRGTTGVGGQQLGGHKPSDGPGIKVGGSCLGSPQEGWLRAHHPCVAALQPGRGGREGAACGGGSFHPPIALRPLLSPGDQLPFPRARPAASGGCGAWTPSMRAGWGGQAGPGGLGPPRTLATPARTTTPIMPTKPSRKQSD